MRRLLIIVLLLAAPLASAQSIVRAQGLVADGVAAIGGPVLIGGVDSSGLLQNLSVSADGSFNIGAVVPGTGATNLGKAEDAAHASGDTGVAALAVRNDGGAASFSGADGDYTPIGVTARGGVGVEGWVADGSAAVGNPVIIGGVDGSANAQTLLMDTSGRPVVVGAGTAGSAAGGVLTVQGVASMTALTVAQATASSLNAEVQGDAAHDAPVSGNPVRIAAYSSAAAPADVSADGDATNLWSLRNGALVTNLSAAGALIGGDATNGLDVDVTRLSALVAGSATIGSIADITTSVTPGTAAGNLGKAEDAAHTSADVGVFALAVRNDAAAASFSGLDGDYTPIAVDDNGRVFVYQDQALPAGTNNIGDVDVLSIAAGDNNIGNVDIVTFPDNEPFNVAQINGVTPLMGNGVTGTGSQRVTIASDNTAFSVNIGTFPDNEPFNAAQWGGTAVTGGSGTATAGSPRVVLATDVALPAGTNNIGDMDILSIAAGDNNIGNVDIASAIPAGSNNIGDVDVDSFPAAATVNAEQATITADTTIVAAVANTRLMWAQCSESAASAAAAEVILRHGVEAAGSCTGNMIGAPINLAANETGDPITLGSIGFAVASGVCLDRISGTITCVAHTKVEAAP